ncbi:MAG: hypothetical protein RL434_1775 [Pseudomonadota bacterium]|jgi:hypothetical protein
MKYLTGHSQEIKGLLAALGIECKGVTGLRLIVEPDRIVRLELERLATSDEVAELTTWILKQSIEAEQLDD